jgi:hypothetical protein
MPIDPGTAGRNEVRVNYGTRGRSAAFENKLTLLHADGSQVLPRYYSDNYVSLLPGEERAVSISIAEGQRKGGLRLGLRGWNATPVRWPCASKWIVSHGTPRKPRYVRCITSLRFNVMPDTLKA